MRKIVVFMHVSLDGFVAGSDGGMDWIHVDDEIFDYAGDRTNHADTALYGRVTFDMMEGYWPTAGNSPTASKHDIEHSSWYNKVSKVVLSKSLKGQTRKNVRIVSDNVDQQIKEIKQAPGSEIIIFGSPSACHSLMKHGLIDEYWLFVNPVLLGEGIPLFKNIGSRTSLKLLKTKQFTSGVVLLHYTT